MSSEQNIQYIYLNINKYIYIFKNCEIENIFRVSIKLIETRVEVWEKQEIVSTQFRVYPKLPQVSITL